MAAEHNFRIQTLIETLGLDQESFHIFLEWALSEHLLKVLGDLPELDASFFRRSDALKAFRDVLRQRTRRQWSHHDLEAIYDRVKQQKEAHYRAPISYEEYLKLLWQVPWRCAKCGAEPPEVKLHIDHILPASLGGPSKRANLQFLCSKDNLHKSNNREVTPPWLDLL